MARFEGTGAQTPFVVKGMAQLGAINIEPALAQARRGERPWNNRSY